MTIVHVHVRLPQPHPSLLFAAGQMDAIELEICVLPYLGRPLTINIDIIDSTTTSDVLDTVKSILDDDLGKCRPTTWNLFENWMDIGKTFFPQTWIYYI